MPKSPQLALNAIKLVVSDVAGVVVETHESPTLDEIRAAILGLNGDTSATIAVLTGDGEGFQVLGGLDGRAYLEHIAGGEAHGPSYGGENDDVFAITVDKWDAGYPESWLLSTKEAADTVLQSLKTGELPLWAQQ